VSTARVEVKAGSDIQFEEQVRQFDTGQVAGRERHSDGRVPADRDTIGAELYPPAEPFPPVPPQGTLGVRHDLAALGAHAAATDDLDAEDRDPAVTLQHDFRLDAFGQVDLAADSHLDLTRDRYAVDLPFAGVDACAHGGAAVTHNALYIEQFSAENHKGSGSTQFKRLARSDSPAGRKAKCENRLPCDAGYRFPVEFAVDETMRVTDVQTADDLDGTVPQQDSSATLQSELAGAVELRLNRFAVEAKLHPQQVGQDRPIPGALGRDRAVEPVAAVTAGEDEPTACRERQLDGDAGHRQPQRLDVGRADQPERSILEQIAEEAESLPAEDTHVGADDHASRHRPARIVVVAMLRDKR
jgi:hypothetical protein